MTASVLIVDDSLTVRMDLHEAFEAEGFASVLCASGAEARSAFAAQRFDVAVLDVLLPDADGVELIRELRTGPDPQDTVWMLLTSEAEARHRPAAPDSADEYVGKPYDAVQVVARAQVLLRDRPTGPAGYPVVLVIDDSLTFREELRELLEPEGYTVLCADSGEEGLRLAAARRPDAVVVDGVMPGIDGATVIRRIRLDAALRDTPCLLMTAADDYATELQMLDAGADGFVRKQADLAVVPAKLAAMLRQSASALPIETELTTGPYTVLVVDGNRPRLAVTGDALLSDGYHVVRAEFGDDALRVLTAQAVDCIVVGLHGPDDDGRVTCRRIKAVPRLGEIPLVMTGERDEALLDCLTAGADDYVSVDEGARTLLAHVRAQVRRKQLHDRSTVIREELMRRELDAAAERAARQLAETRAALVEELEWRNRELEAFSGSVSHDLRGPLQVIGSYAEELLEDDDGLGERSRHRIQRILAAARRMGELVDSLLILARASRGELRRVPFDLTGTAWQVIREVQAREPDRRVAYTVHEAMSVDADEGLIRIVLDNLINNGSKFTRRAENPAIEVGWTGPGENSRYFVRDNGVGFPPGRSAELFQPFARLHNADDFPGIGIGLTTVHRAVLRHGGEVWAEGEDGRGSTFWFTLPPESDRRDGAPGHRPPDR